MVAIRLGSFDHYAIDPAARFTERTGSVRADETTGAPADERLRNRPSEGEVARVWPVDAGTSHSSQRYIVVYDAQG